VSVAVGAGLAGEDWVRSGCGDELVGDVAGATGVRFGRAFGDGLEDADADAVATGLAGDTGLDWATQCSRTASAGQVGAFTDTPVSFPDARQA
jgi:hypothetical protein